MAEIRSFGLQSIKIGDMQPDGTLDNLESLGVTYQDTAELVRDEPEVAEEYSEENDEPEEIFLIKGPGRINFSILNIDPAVAVKVMGGTAVGNPATWKEPTDTPVIEKGIQIVTKTGLTITCPRCRISARPNWQFRKRGVMVTPVVARIMNPGIEGVAPISYTPGS